MKGDPDVEDLRVWSVVASTVRPLPGRHVPAPPRPSVSRAAPPPAPGAPARLVISPSPRPAKVLEAGLQRRLVKGREAAARIDLHGLGYDAARAALTGFVLRSVEDGWRAALVITGKGTRGEGVIRRQAPEWLAEPPLAQHVAGVSQAHRRHGGEGALYVALKRKRS
jgi:DNA-nicking Smr family endonuclease